MSAGTSATLCLLFVSVLVSTEQKTIKAESGQNITLPCQAPNNNNIVAVKWSRADQGDQYVLYYRGKQLDPDNQHPSFKNRVDLQDRQMKDGDVSLILKNVTTADNGTFECRVAQRETSQERADLKLLSTIYVRVAPPPPGPSGGTSEGGGSVGLKAGPSVFSLLVVAAAVYVEI